MKKTHLLFLIAFCGLFINSCKKELAIPAAYSTNGVTSSTSTPAVGSLTLTVNGVVESSSLSFAAVYTSGNTLQVIGQLPSNHGVSISVNNVAVGTFNLAANGLLLVYSTSTASSDAYLATSVGTVTITSYTSTTIAGTFQFTGVNLTTSATKVVTGGTFSLSYTVI